MTATLEDAETNVDSVDAAEKPGHDQLEAQRQEIESLQKTIASLERRERLARLLRESDAIDVDAATLLTELAVAQMAEPDLEAAVAELKSARPFLFKSSRQRGSGVMSPRESDPPRGATIDRAAEHAAESGSRRDLLRYLRLKRSA